MDATQLFWFCRSSSQIRKGDPAPHTPQLIPPPTFCHLSAPPHIFCHLSALPDEKWGLGKSDPVLTFKMERNQQENKLECCHNSWSHEDHSMFCSSMGTAVLSDGLMMLCTGAVKDCRVSFLLFLN
jgi:hypothetical protein